MATTLAGVLVTLYMLLIQRSLYWDEAAMVSDIINRSLLELISNPLDNSQTAPVLYLFAVKFCGLLFGYSEASLRLTSFIAYLGSMVMVFFLLKNIFKSDKMYAWLGTGIVATFSFLMVYATMLKPYMTEAFIILATLVIHDLARRKIIHFSIFTFFCVIAVFFANSALFFIAAIYIVEFYNSLKLKNIRFALYVFLSGMFVAVIFAVYFLLWLSPVADSELMTSYWSNNFFRFYPVSMDIYLMDYSLIMRLFLPISQIRILKYLIIILSLYGFMISLHKKNQTSYIIGLAYLFFFIASNFEKAPVKDRLCLFFYPFIILYIIVFFNKLWVFFSSKKHYSILKYLLIPIAGLLFISNFNLSRTAHYSETFNEANPLIEYVRKHIQKDETLFSFIRSNFVINYKTEYTKRIGESATPIIFGQSIYDWIGVDFDRTISNSKNYPWDVLWDYGYDAHNYPNEIDEVIKTRKAYLIFSHMNNQNLEKRINYGLDKLRNIGELTEIMNINRTYLYYFSTNK